MGTPSRAAVHIPVGTDGLTTFRMRTTPEGGRLRLTAGSTTSARRDLQALRPDCLPFGPCLPASLACCFSRRLNSGSHVLALSFNPGSRPPRGWQSQRPLTVRLPADQAEATVSRALRTPELPPTHGSVGYRWQNTGSLVLDQYACDLVSHWRAKRGRVVGRRRRVRMAGVAEGSSSGQSHHEVII